MSNRGAHRAIETQVEALGPVLYAGMASSLASAHGRRRGLDHTKYPHLLPLLVRTELREFFESNVMPPGWVVSGDSRRMGQLLLAHGEMNLEIRVLKERRATHPGGVPVAGSNNTRRRAWQADRLDLIWPSSSSRGGVVIGPGSPVELVRLLLVWDFVPGTRLQQFTLRVVHTIGAGIYGRAVPCDLILDVKDGGEIFTIRDFAGAAEDYDLFARGDVVLDEKADDLGT